MRAGMKTGMYIIGGIVIMTVLLAVMVARMMPAGMHEGTGGTLGLEATELRAATEADVPEPYAMALNPYAPDDPVAIEAGSTLAARRCAGCHGASLQGGRGGPANLVRSGQERSEQFLYWAITEGSRQGMPALGRTLSDEERWQLVVFVGNLGQ